MILHVCTNSCQDNCEHFKILERHTHQRLCDACTAEQKASDKRDKRRDLDVGSRGETQSRVNLRYMSPDSTVTKNKGKRKEIDALKKTKTKCMMQT